MWPCTWGRSLGKGTVRAVSFRSVPVCDECVDHVFQVFPFSSMKEPSGITAHLLRRYSSSQPTVSLHNAPLVIVEACACNCDLESGLLFSARLVPVSRSKHGVHCSSAFCFCVRRWGGAGLTHDGRYFYCSERAARVRFHGDGPLLGVQGAGKAMEVFRIRSEAQSKKKMKR